MTLTRFQGRNCFARFSGDDEPLVYDSRSSAADNDTTGEILPPSIFGCVGRCGRGIDWPCVIKRNVLAAADVVGYD